MKDKLGLSDKDKDKDKEKEKEGQEGSGLKTAGPEGEITAGLLKKLLVREAYWAFFFVSTG